MKRWEAIEKLIDVVEDALVIHANGMISRESFAYRDRPRNFYMIGSMGLASSIGLGVALNRPECKVVVLDGDGNVLMSLGALAMVGERQPANFVHVVLDNASYASTGGQRSISDRIDLDAFAQAAGYRHVRRVTRLDELTPVFSEMMAVEGPSFLLVKVEPGNVPGIPRVACSPEMIAMRFKEAVCGCC